MHALTEARLTRNEGIERVRAKNREWMHLGSRLLGEMKLERAEATGEQMRIWLRSKGLGEPSSAHAWGALTLTAVRRGVLIDTGRSEQMWAKRSHARRTPIWRFA